MQTIAITLGDGLTFLGVFMLMAAFFRIWKFSSQVKSGPIARRWHFLNAYIALFVIGYIPFSVLFWRQQHWYGLLISIILFFGSIFVWIITFLTHQTVLDMRRVALLEHENITDALTGLYNRRYLDQRMASEYESARRYRYPLSVLMLDLDHFKSLNDTHGHRAGDLALRFVSELILDGIREPDIAARYGGEEFVIIAPHTPLDDAVDLAERVRRHIESHELTLASAGEHRQALQLTVSIGVAELSADLSSGRQLVERADEALYRAKQSGRNRVCQYQAAPAGRFVSAA